MRIFKTLALQILVRVSKHPEDRLPKYCFLFLFLAEAQNTGGTQRAPREGNIFCVIRGPSQRTFHSSALGAWALVDNLAKINRGMDE